MILKKFLFLMLMGSAALTVASCAPKKIQDSAEYQAACHGMPLDSIEARNQALEDGYAINAQFKCIDHASFAAMQRYQAERLAANTPEAIAKQHAERERIIAEENAKRAYEALIAPQKNQAAPQASTFIVHPVEINTATQFELARMPSIGSNTVKVIIQERSKSPFESWPDVVHRVIGLSAAQSVVYASMGGLMVNGQSFQGAAPDQQMTDEFVKRHPNRH